MEWRIEAIVLAIGFVVMINGWIIPYILGGVLVMWFVAPIILWVMKNNSKNCEKLGINENKCDII
ncbi:TPA: hypothetical protein QHY55_004857 [Klebsiella pneumoniae subsp. pneumoniae]|jgi:hypothetical protein|nr:hypothetical protein [Klebsiella variicola]HDS5086708.1 hypothetical protein [Klebsiella pneumoniae subsp. pneumoniae]